jgi:hypothetical protein
MKDLRSQALRWGTAIGAATSGSSTSTAIPNGADGNKARKVAVSVTLATYVLFGASGDSVTATTGLVLNPGDGLVVFHTDSHTHIHHLQVTSAGRISMMAVDSL